MTKFSRFFESSVEDLESRFPLTRPKNKTKVQILQGEENLDRALIKYFFGELTHSLKREDASNISRVRVQRCLLTFMF